ncbi:SDR family oxidoreductase [Acidovorax sp. LjRoot66]|uniref:SDR family oxidoreductase n=1 Tax=Acidovorax sp. LjRoot66 TaxID=3342334 RepID=UPI003ECDDC85
MTNQPKIALVTGATRGIGLATTRQLAQAGVHVLLAGRSIATAAQAAQALQSEGLSVEPLALDVTVPASIAAAAAHVQSTYGRLDILVNNAGVLLDAMDRKPSEQSLQVWRETFDTNVFALVEVTQAFLPLLKAAAAGRIVNLSSQLASFGLHTDPASPIYDFKLPAYNASKSVVNAWTVHLAHELRGTPLKVNAVHPGYVMTDMNGGNGEIDAEAGAKTSVAMALLDDSGPSGSFTHLGKALPW